MSKVITKIAIPFGISALDLSFRLRAHEDFDERWDEGNACIRTNVAAM